MIYTIEKETLTALGDAIREKQGIENCTINDNFKLLTVFDSMYPSHYGIQRYQIDNEAVKQLKIKLTINFDMPDDLLWVYYSPKYESHPVSGAWVQLDFSNSKAVEFVIDSNTVSFVANKHPMHNSIELSFSVEIIGLDENGKVPGRYTPMQMVEAIESIEAKVPVKPIELTGDCSYACVGSIASAYIEANSDTIITKDISNSSYMFQNSTLETIPFELNFKQCSGAYDATKINYMFFAATKLQHIPDFDVKHADYYADCNYIFYNCHSLEQVPYIYNAYPASINYMFGYCYRLREIPEDYFDTWNFTRVNNYQYAYSQNVFYCCYSLRSISPKLLSKLIGNETVNKSSSNIAYYGMCNDCRALDELIDVPVAACELTSNALGGMVYHCYRLKNFTFETNEDGSPKTAKWKNQTLDLWQSNTVGLAGSASYITGTNSGITADKEVKDDATYQALKNDPDWFTTKIQYSRFNHDSAVATINSLPDTSAYGTNTVKFFGSSGNGTDGGAINTLTEAEIAVAAAKGWTVTFGY